MNSPDLAVYSLWPRGASAMSTLQTVSLRFDMSPNVTDWGPIQAAAAAHVG